MITGQHERLSPALSSGEIAQNSISANKFHYDDVADVPRMSSSMSIALQDSSASVLAKAGALPAGIEQMELFSDFVEHTPDGYSNTIELFDQILKFSSARVRATPEPDERRVLFRGREYMVTIMPANVRTRNGKTLSALFFCLRSSSIA
jgi:hypothetical protein